jgi:hypothetical protein
MPDYRGSDLGGGGGGGGGGYHYSAPASATSIDHDLYGRLSLLEQNFPQLFQGADMTVPMRLASMPLSTDDLLTAAAGAFDDATLSTMGEQLKHMDPIVAASMFGQMHPELQNRLRASGYQPPQPGYGGPRIKLPIIHTEFGYDGSIFSAIGAGIAAPFDAMNAATRTVGGGVLNALKVAGDTVPHLYRAMEASQAPVLGDNEGIDDARRNQLSAALTYRLQRPLTAEEQDEVASVVAGNPTQNEEVRSAWEQVNQEEPLFAPNSLLGMWGDTSHGEHVIRWDVQNEALAIFGDDPHAWEMFRVARKLAEGYSLEEIAGGQRRRETDQQGYVDDYLAAYNLQGDERFQRAQELLKTGKISMGRSFADAAGFTPNTRPYTLLSGSTDALVSIFGDPTIVGGKLLKSSRVLVRSLASADEIAYAGRIGRLLAEGGEGAEALRAWENTLSGAERFVQARRNAFFERTWKFAEQWADVMKQAASGTDEGAEALASWRRANPMASRAIDELLRYSDTVLERPIRDAEDIFGFYADEMGRSAIAEGRLGRSYVTDALELPAAPADFRFNPARLRAGAKDGWNKAINWTTDHVELLNQVDEPATRVGTVSRLPVATPLRTRAREAAGRIVRREAGLSDLTLGPLDAFSSFWRALTTHVPLGGALNLMDDKAIDQFANLVELGQMVDMPQAIRNAYIRDFVFSWADPLVTHDGQLLGQAADVGARHAVAERFFKDLFARAGLDATPDGARWIERWTEQSRKAFGLGDSVSMLDGSTSKLPIWLYQGSSQLMMPKTRELIGQIRRLDSMRRSYRFMSADWTESFVHRVFAPAVLLRLGFVSRAAGEELFSFIARHGSYSWIKAQAALASVPREAFEESLDDLADTFAKLAVDQRWSAARRAELQYLATLNTAQQRDVLYGARTATRMLSWIENTAHNLGSRLLGRAGEVSSPSREAFDVFMRAQMKAHPDILGDPSVVVDQVLRGIDLPYWFEHGELEPLTRLPKLAPLGQINNLEAWRSAWHSTGLVDFIARQATRALRKGARQLVRDRRIYEGGVSRWFATDQTMLDAARDMLLDPTVQRAYARGVAGQVHTLLEATPKNSSNLLVRVGTDPDSEQPVYLQLNSSMSDFREHSAFDDLGRPRQDFALTAAAAHAFDDRVTDELGARMIAALENVSDAETEARLEDLLGYWDNNGQPYPGGSVATVRSIIRGMGRPEQDALFDILQHGSSMVSTPHRQLVEAVEAGRDDAADLIKELIDDGLESGDIPATSWDVLENWMNENPVRRDMVARVMALPRRERLALFRTPTRIVEGKAGYQTVLSEAAREAFLDPEIQKIARQQRRARVLADGSPVAMQLPAGRTRWHLPMLQREAADKLVRLNPQDVIAYIERAGLTEEDGARLISLLNTHKGAHHFTLLRTIPEEMDWLPYGTLATSDVDAAERLTRQIRDLLGVPSEQVRLGYRDLLDASQMRTGQARRLVWKSADEAHLPAVFDRATWREVQESQLPHVELHDYNLPRWTDGNGNTVFGVTLDEAWREWADHAAADFVNYFHGSEGQVLHEVLQPALRRGRSTFHDWSNVPGADMPARIVGPNYSQVTGSVAAGNTSLLDRTVANGFGWVNRHIDSIIRQPMFLHNYTKALLRNRRLEAAMFAPKVQQELDRLSRLIGMDTDNLLTHWDDVSLLATSDDAIPLLSQVNSPLAQLNDADFGRLRELMSHRYKFQADLRQAAMQRAINDSVPFIDDHEIRSQFQEWVRNATPFLFAEEQFLKRWARTIRHSPEAIRRGQLMVHGLTSAGWIQENPLDGKLEFRVPIAPAFADMLEALPFINENFSVLAADAFTGEIGRVLPGISSDRFAMPSVTPIISIPATLLTRWMPQLKPPLQSALGELSVGRTVPEQLLPSWAWRAYNYFANSEDYQRELNSVTVNALQLMAAQGKFPSEYDDPQDFIDEMRRTARTIVGARIVMGFAMPTTPRFAPGVDLEAELAKLYRDGIPARDAMQAFADQHSLSHDERTMLAEAVNRGATGPEVMALLQDNPQTAQFSDEFQEALEESDSVNEAVVKFLQRDQYAGVTYGITATERAGDAPVPASEHTLTFLQTPEAQDLAARYPLGLAWLIPTGGAEDPFSLEAYHTEIAMNLRTLRSPEELTDQIYFRAGADNYFEMQQNYDERITAAGEGTEEARKLEEERDLMLRAYRDMHPAFSRVLLSSDRETMHNKTIDQIRSVLALPGLPPAITGTRQFLGLRVLMNAYDQLQSVLTYTRTDQRQAARDQRAAARTAFRQVADEFAMNMPELASLVDSVLYPSVDIDENGA